MKVSPAAFRKKIIVEATQIKNGPGERARSLAAVGLKGLPQALGNDCHRNTTNGGASKVNERWIDIGAEEQPANYQQQTQCCQFAPDAWQPFIFRRQAVCLQSEMERQVKVCDACRNS